MLELLKRHWPEYLIEGACLGLFMVSAFSFGTLLEHPASAIHQAVPDPTWRRLLMGLAMGGTAIAIIYSPWGKRSGAHINPATTLAFVQLGKVAPNDALFYILSQFVGALLGAAVASAALATWIAHPAVNYLVTMPGESGPWAAFLAEIAIAFILMSVILHVSNQRRWHSLTGICAGLLVALYIAVEAPVSGMSMNPARSFASAVPAHQWRHLWIYFTAPLIGMLSAAQLYLRTHGAAQVHCAKLHHQNSQRCIFCGKAATSSSPASPNSKLAA
jgi:aquaporin Z